MRNIYLTRVDKMWSPGLLLLCHFVVKLITIWRKTETQKYGNNYPVKAYKTLIKKSTYIQRNCYP